MIKLVTNQYDALIQKFGVDFESIQHFMITNLEALEDKDLNISTNKKLDGIPSIPLPSEVTRLHFLAMVEKNKYLLDNERVAVLYDYLKNNHMCVNYRYCIGSCYNNRLNYQYLAYSMSTLRNLYILLTNEKSFIEQCNKAFLNLRYVRFSVSGDVNAKIFNVYKKIMKANPDVTFYMYTKNYKLFNDMKTTPRNLVVNVSVWGDGLDQILRQYPNLAKHNFYHVYQEGFDPSSVTKIAGKKYSEGICSKKQNGGKEVSCIRCKKCMTKKQYVTTKER